MCSYFTGAHLDKTSRSFYFKVKDLRVFKVDRHFGVKKISFLSCMSLPIINDIGYVKSVNLSEFHISHL